MQAREWVGMSLPDGPWEEMGPGTPTTKMYGDPNSRNNSFFHLYVVKKEDNYNGPL